MTRKHIVSLVAASLILAGTAFAQQSPQEPQAPAGGQPGSMMRPGMMAHGDRAPWMDMGRHRLGLYSLAPPVAVLSVCRGRLRSTRP